MEPRLRLAQEALEARRSVAAANGNPLVKQRALATIDRDIQKLNGFPLDKLDNSSEAILAIIKSATPTSDVEELITKAVGNDPVLADYFKDIWDQTKGKILDLPPLQRVKAWEEATGLASKVVKAWRAFTHVSSDPFGSTEMEQLIMMTDLVGEIPGGDAIALKQHLRLMTVFMESINRSIKDIKYREAQLNLKALVEAAHGRTQGCGEDWGATYPLALFGDPVVIPLITMTKTQFLPGEPIAGTWCALREWNGGWVGLIRASDLQSEPADQRGLETVNDKHDITYASLTEKTEGSFSFVQRVEPGSYLVRMFPSDSAGEVATEKAISVVACQGVFFRTQKSQYRQGEPVVVEYCGTTGASDDWITVVPVGEPNTEYWEWYWLPYTGGAIVFNNALAPGTYEVRLHYAWNTKSYNVVKRSTFTVVN